MEGRLAWTYSPATEEGEWVTAISLASQGTSPAAEPHSPAPQEPGSLEKLRAGSGQALCSQGNCILTPAEKPWPGLGDKGIENQRGAAAGCRSHNTLTGVLVDDAVCRKPQL